MFTFDEKRLPNYVRYVEQQKEHHSQNHLIPILERVEEVSPRTIRDTAPNYQTDEPEWWNEMRVIG
jgi:hypothetical protein